jgi:geranylgeranyl pyrophosphate synthase
MTLPMIHFMKTAPLEHRTLLRSLLERNDPDKAERIRNLIVPSRSIDFARDRAKAYIDRARGALVDLPDTEARRMLDLMAEFVIARND